MDDRSQATVTLSQVAELAGMGGSAVSNWRRRFHDFPEPVEVTVGGRELFSLPAVEAWLAAHGRLDPGRANERLFFEAANLIRGAASTAQHVEVIAAAIALWHVVGDRVEHHAVSYRDTVRAAETDPALAGVFEPLARLETDVLQEILELVRHINPGDRVAVFEWVLRRRGRFDDFASSDRLTSLVSQFARGSAQVFDPAAGEGGFLVAAAETATSPLDHGGLALYGQEVNAAAWRIAKQRFLLRGLDVDLRLGDSLLEDAFGDLRVETVVTDPPYNSKNPLSPGALTEGRWSPRIVRAKSANFVWLQHVIGHLAENGRACVLLPNASLFGEGREGDLRTEMIRRGEVEAVVSLPSGSATQTSIPLALWIIRPSRPAGEADRVLLVDAEGADGTDNRAVLDADRIDRIADVVQSWRETGDIRDDDRAFARSVSILDLIGAGSNLMPRRWVQAPVEFDVDQRRAELSAAIDRFIDARARVAARRDLTPVEGAEPVRWISVKDLVDGGRAKIVRGRHVKSDLLDTGGVRVLRTRDVRDRIVDDEPRYIEESRIKPGTALTEPGDIVVSPASGKLRAIVDPQGGHLLAQPLQALRVLGSWVDPLVAAAFLESPRNRRFATGVSAGYARVDLRDLELPLLPLEEVSRLRDMLDELRAAEQGAQDLVAAAQDVRCALLEVAGGESQLEGH